MSDAHTMPAQPRDRAGKGTARAARRDGMVPAVIYGGKKTPAMILIEDRVLRKQASRAAFFGTVYDIKVEGGGTEKVLPRDLQLDPITDVPVHADFLRVTGASRVAVAVPVNFVNEDASPGLKQGGVLNVVRHEVELSCRADTIPDTIEVDLTGKEINDSLHISEVTLPEGVEPTITDRDFTIATIAAPNVVEEQPAEEQAEGGGESGEAEEAKAEE
ncbi:50S ribosomal protein L25/general stress protein Ctc [Algihabitans albus]|uniref:50S ribosomal protein L25/general stress protein Ctc n=1 Tax=Algihabitans albus TaxID=2164067 RepID=UPI000E5C9926|nr:50S ribosomal protein L25/general stress protein Ctc [Algihabitans albus]